MSEGPHRQSLLLPIVIPLGALAVIGAVLFGFSRILLGISHTAATVTAWEAAGLNDVGLRRMSLGGGLVMWGRRAADHRSTGSTGP